MSREAIAVDLGSRKVVAVRGVAHNDGRIEVLGVGVQPHSGVFTMAEVQQAEEASDVVREALRKALDGKLRRLRSLPVHVAVSGKQFKASWASAPVSLSKEEPTIITSSDLEEAISFVMNSPKHEGYVVFRFYPFVYKLDEKLQVEDPLGSRARSLRVEGLAAYMNDTLMNNLTAVLHEAGISDRTLTFEYQPMASSYAVLTPGDRRENFLVLDLGHVKVDYAFWHQGSLRLASSLPAGSYQALVRALHQRFDISLEKAGELLSLLGDINDPEAGEPEIQLSLGGQGIQKTFSRKEALKVVHRELDRLLDGFRQKLLKQLSVTGVIMVGGLSRVPGLLAYAEQRLQIPVQQGRIHGLDDLAGREDPGLAVAAGVLKLALGGLIPTRRRRRSLREQIKNLWKTFF